MLFITWNLIFQLRILNLIYFYTMFSNQQTIKNQNENQKWNKRKVYFSKIALCCKHVKQCFLHVHVGTQNYCSFWSTRQFIYLACDKTWKHTYLPCEGCIWWTIYTRWTDLSRWIKVSIIISCTPFVRLILTFHHTNFWIKVSIIISCRPFSTALIFHS